MTTLHRLFARREPPPPVDELAERRQERLAAHQLYGGRRTIDVAPIEVPAGSYDPRHAARHESSDGRHS